MTMNSVIKSSRHKMINSHNNSCQIVVPSEFWSRRVRQRKAATVEKVKNQSTKRSAQVIFGVKVFDKQSEDQYKISV